MPDGDIPPGWTAKRIDGTVVWGRDDSGLTATSGYEPMPPDYTRRHYVLIKGNGPPPFVDVAAIVKYLTDHAPLTLVPGWTPHGYDPRSWCFLETTDEAAAELWYAAFESVTERESEVSDDHSGGM